MGMPVRHTEWTVEMVNALPEDGNRYEVVDGELLVSPGPSYTHQWAAQELYWLMRLFVESTGHDMILAPAAVAYGPGTEIQPDLFVLPRAPGGRRARRLEDVGRLVLAVEVTSPSTARSDRHLKRRLFARERVPEYWIVDPAARVVERWRPEDEEPEFLTERLAWKPVETVAPLVIDLEAYFRQVHRD